MSDQFNKPLNTVIEEDIPVLKSHLEIDEKTHQTKVVNSYENFKQKTIYFDPPKEKLSCKRGQHSWVVQDKHKYLFVCTKCPHKININPVHFKVDGNKIINLSINQVI